MAPTRKASGSHMPPEGISFIFHRVVKRSELNLIHSYHPQVPEMGSNAKKKIRRRYFIFHRIVKESELNLIHSYHPQVSEMGSNAKKKIQRRYFTFHRVVKEYELNLIHSYHPQVPEMGSNAKKKIRRRYLTLNLSSNDTKFKQPERTVSLFHFFLTNIYICF
jgi:hypothetical protein